MPGPADEMVQPIVYFFPPYKSARGAFGHVAIGGPNLTLLPELRRDIYLSFGMARGINKGRIKDDSHQANRSDEANTYGGQPVELKLPPCQKADFDKACKSFLELDRRNYAIRNNNCATAVKKCLQDCGYPITFSKIDLPSEVAKFAQQLIQPSLYEKRSALINDTTLDPLAKIIALLENELERLKIEIDKVEAAQTAKRYLDSIKSACSSYQKGTGDCQAVINRFIEAAPHLDAQTALHVRGLLDILPDPHHTAVLNSTHSDALLKLQKDLAWHALSGNKLVLAAQPGTARLEPPLLNKEDILKRINDLLKQTQREILLTGFPLDETLFEALNHLNEECQKSNKKIKVFVLTSHSTATNITQRALSFFKSLVNTRSRKLTQQFPNLTINHAEHIYSATGSFQQRMMIIDGHTAILSNVDYHRDNPQPSVDLATVVHDSSLVSYLREDFTHAWRSKNTRSQNSYNPFNLTPKNTSSSYPEIPVIFLSKKAKGDFIHHQDFSPCALALQALIGSAKSSINIITKDLTHERIAESLMETLKRDPTIKMNIILEKNSANQNTIKKLSDVLKKHPHSLDIRWIADINQAIPNENPTSINANLVTVDDEFVLTGSSTLNNQSIYHAREADIVMHDQATAQTYNNTIFNPLFSQAIRVFQDPQIALKVAGPNIAIAKSATPPPSLPAQTQHMAYDGIWHSNEGAGQLFMIIQDQQNLNSALQELTDHLNQTHPIEEYKEQEVSVLPANTTRLSCISKPEGSFGLVETCVKPDAEINSRLVFSTSFKIYEEEKRLMSMIAEQIKQASNSLGARPNEKLILALSSLASGEKAGIYERAYLGYCRDNQMICRLKDGTELSGKMFDHYLNQPPLSASAPALPAEHTREHPTRGPG